MIFCSKTKPAMYGRFKQCCETATRQINDGRSVRWYCERHASEIFEELTNEARPVVAMGQCDDERKEGRQMMTKPSPTQLAELRRLNHPDATLEIRYVINAPIWIPEIDRWTSYRDSTFKTPQVRALMRLKLLNDRGEVTAKGRRALGVSEKVTR